MKARRLIVIAVPRQWVVVGTPMLSGRRTPDATSKLPPPISFVYSRS